MMAQNQETSRLHALLQANGLVPGTDEFTEIELSPESLGSLNLLEVFGNGEKVAWVGDSFVANFNKNNPEPYGRPKLEICVLKRGDITHFRLYAPTLEDITPLLEAFMDNLAQMSFDHDGYLHIRGKEPTAERTLLPVSNATLERFIITSPRFLYFVNIEFKESHSHLLVNAAGDDVHLVLTNCGLRAALVDAVRNSRGPTMLTFAQRIPFGDIAFHDFMSKVAKDTRLEQFGLIDIELDHIQWQQVASGLAENHGIHTFDLRQSNAHASDQNWNTIMGVLSSHQTIKTLLLERRSGEPALSIHQQKTRATQIVQLLKTNTVLTSIHMAMNGIIDDDILRERIKPGLEINEFRPGVLALARVCDSSLQDRLLGLALAKVSDKYHLEAFLVSEFHEQITRLWELGKRKRLVERVQSLAENKRNLEDEINRLMKRHREVEGQHQAAVSNLHMHDLAEELAGSEKSKRSGDE